MKSLFNCLILCSLVILVGCSGGSSKPPTVTPPPGGDVWLITSLQSSDSNPNVSTPVTVTATVTLNGSPAPDDTQVEFLRNAGGGVFVPDNGQVATVLTTGGQATIGFFSDTAGNYAVQARVKTITSQITVAYKEPTTSGALQIWNINPAAGSYAGGENVILTGKGIRNPVEVVFTVQSVQYQGVVVHVVESDPVETVGTITILTPQPTAADKTITSPAEVKVTVGVGTTDEQVQSYPSAFTYISDSVIIGDPVIFGVEPLYGRSQGGESVTILGLNFAVDETKELIKNFDKVYFTFEGQQLLAEVEQWSETQIAVITPRFSLTPLTENKSAGVILTRVGGASVEKNDIFIVKSDIAEPEITGISPTAGPLDGGTEVTITGHGFEIPIQVHFGDLEATGCQVYDDQSLADNDVITCLTPDYSQQGQLPPIFVSVRVTNLQTGNNATASQTFRYGDILYVGQANPTEGQIGDLFALYGAGFEDPLTVWFRSGGEVEFDVISVTGTELTLRSPTDMAPTCADRSGDFRVVLNESNRFAEGGQYTLLGSNPTITSVDPIFVDETDFGNGVSPSEIDIFGVRFADELLVRINNFTIAPNEVDVVTPEHIHINQIPAPNDFGLVFNTGSCTTGTGLQGIRNEPTPVNVTVRNLPLGCEDTLVAGLVYVPEDQDCVAAPVLNVGLDSNFPATTAGTCSLAQPLVLANNGAGDLQIQTAILVGRFFFDAGASSQNAGPILVPAFTANTDLDVYFCPDVPNGLVYQGQLVISSNDPGSPTQRNLTGLEATPPEIGTSPYGDGETWPFPATTSGGCSPAEILTITNTGISDLTISSTTLGDATHYNIVNPTANEVLTQGQSYPLQVEFCPTAVGPNLTTTLNIAHDAGNEPTPIQITLDGNGI